MQSDDSHSPVSLITLTTDFGTVDHYVAQMKGVLLARSPSARLIDVTHQLPPQDVTAAALLMEELYPPFPTGTVHLAVIDPGVGSNRTMLAAQAHGQYFVAPNNGLLSFVMKSDPGFEAVMIENRNLFRDDVSQTFHGRDIMAPIAAELANGRPLSEIGPVCEAPVLLDEITPEVSGEKISGRIIRIDHFGNLITNIRESDISHSVSTKFVITSGDLMLQGLSSSYASHQPDEALAIIGSSGRLEVAVNQGNAAKVLNLGIGDEVMITTEEQS
ncbi:SAM hydrolase/SAM-dependent halogenase family protein [Calycomorphotria hydatis]|uniref:Adenosyl-chloride synthase n=1 Tax=Calycomorphotria hydatis TaxID=2528027 RepID=A0A517T3D3_9PLAN|nr:SAM-dependent chlorinase/fluorinase [Calycomorphotria hydatis]QDT62876.1 Adenosyl-chloride synthase [Calycomorphotria hydatis]